MRPSPKTHSGPPSAGPIEQVLGRLKHAFVFAALFSGVINILMLTGSVFMMQVYDRVLPSRSVSTLVALAALTVAIYAFIGLLEFIRSRMMARVGEAIDADLRPKVFDRIIAHAVSRTPNVGTQPSRDLEAVRSYFSGPAPFSLFDMPWVPVYVAANFLLHPVLGAVTLGAVVVMLVLAVLSEWAARKGANETLAAGMKAHILVEEAYASAEVIHVMGMRPSFGARWAGVVEEMVRLQGRVGDKATLFNSLSKVLRLILGSVALGVGAYLAIKGEVTAGVIIGGSIIMSRAMAPIDQVISHWKQFVGFRKAQARLEQVLGGIEADNRMTLPAPKGAITVEAAVVVPPGGSKPLLQGITFAIPPGSGLGVIGPSGAGKSSLARALVGVWPVAKGAVRLDGAKLDQFPQDQLGRSIGYLPQEVGLLSGTIQDNIARFSPSPDPEAVLLAARRANVHDLVLRLPDGYNTRLGPDGIQLSAGQRQRIALARAMYGSPALLVLDEPNANLDAEGEEALFLALRDAQASGTTVVIIAHRPSAIRAVSHLIYIQEGRQVAFGTKDEVLAKLQGERASKAAAGSGGLSVVRE